MRRILRRIVLTAWLTGALSASASEFSIVEYMNIRHATMPMLDARGIEIAYVSDITGIPQVWRVPAIAGYPKQMTFDTEGASGCWWSPTDPAKLLVAIPADKKAPVQLVLIDPRTGERTRVTEDMLAAHSFGCWSPDGTRFSYTVMSEDQAETEIVEYQVPSGERISLYQGVGLNKAAAYSPDNRFLLLECVNSALSNELRLHDFETGETKLLTDTSISARFSHPVWDKTTTGFSLLTDQGRDFLGLAYWPLDSAQFSWVETPDWDVEDFALSRDGGFLAWSVNENGFSNLHVRNLRRQTELPPSRFPLGVIRDLAFSHDGSRLIFSLASTDRGFDVWVYETYADKLHQVTSSASGGIPSEVFVRPEPITYNSPDGRTIPALWYTPRGTSGKLPVIVAVLGNPGCQTRSELSSWMQYFVSRGWAVLVTNVRGSSGYGRSYQSADDVEKRGAAITDVVSAANWLVSRKDVDRKRIVVLGEGYGGFLALSALADAPKVWAAAVSINGFTDLIGFVDSAPAWKLPLIESEFGTLSQQREQLAALSPFHRVSDIRVPVFLAGVSGVGTETFAQAMKLKNGDVEFLDLPSGLPCTPGERIALYAEIEKFLTTRVLKK